MRRETPTTANGLASSKTPRGKTLGDPKVAGVRLTHPGRVMYPEQGLTKLDLARYYESVADWILPYLIDRPITLVRCPQGRAQKCFYQKHLTESIPKPVEGIRIKEKDSSEIYVTICDTTGLITLVQLGVLEIHPWGSRKDKLEFPDQMIFDLDPGEGVDWSDIVDGARHLRETLDKLDFESFVRLTGGKGLHVVIPLTRRAKWDEVKAFSRAVAEKMVRDDRDRFIATASKAKRANKIYVDYLRNSRGATAIASYSTRARLGAPVATPIRWDELSDEVPANYYHVGNIQQRLSSLAKDPWKDFRKVRQSISKLKRQAVGVD